ncbi:hypothetical protein AVEN_153533-1 [Araneus ventricosus]|uniref:HTH psq-type domain-containing protein n=1 Tax=Araneus ventricosus TaxID=182803 RepID=A0A4Y2G5M5_ARAVE|nr:hypothetical protein AVEN_153533-1 [Araneus ventricosus]
MSGVKRKRKVLNVKQKLKILQKLDNGESASTNAEDVLNEGNAISHSAVLQSVETLLNNMGQRGFDYGDITACVNGTAGTCPTDQLFKHVQCCRIVPETSVLPVPHKK